MNHKTKLEKSTEIIRDAKASQWCYVNTENEFVFMGSVFVIDDIEDYKVYNKAGTIEDYTNEAYMEEILAIIDKNNLLKFYNQNYDPIETNYIKVKE